MKVIIEKGKHMDSPHYCKWPALKYYDQNHLQRIALPLGGIGTISLGGRGDLRDWEIMNRPEKRGGLGGKWWAVV